MRRAFGTVCRLHVHVHVLVRVHVLVLVLVPSGIAFGYGVLSAVLAVALVSADWAKLALEASLIAWSVA